MKRIHHLISTLAALLLALPVNAQTESPAPPEEVFRYVAFDAGDAIEFDWAVEDGAYMYREAFAFESGDASIVFGQPEMPAGEMHSDEFLGEQEIYRGNFFIRVPYTIVGDKPASLPVTINNRGCLDSGFCYLPQTWIETVSLKEASLNPFAATSTASAATDLMAGGASDFPPPDEVFFPTLFAVDAYTVDLGFRVIPEFYLYRDQISVRVVGDNARATQLSLPDGKVKEDEFFGIQQVYYNEVIGRIAIARATAGATELELEVNYQGCADGGLCYLPQTKILTVKLPAANTVTDLTSLSADAVSHQTDSINSGSDVASMSSAAPVSEQARLAEVFASDSIITAIGVAFVAGLLLSFTPCVLPMIPILSGIIAGEGDDVSPMRGFGLAFSYVMGMALVYTAAGIAAALAGAQLQAMFNQPWVLVLFSGLFVVLAFGMFGAFDLQMPSSVQSKLAGVSGNQKSGTTIGAFVMGAISSLVVTACVAPALIAALTIIAQTGDVVRGGTALFAMSLGMGAPLLVVGAAQGKFLPKAGPWMVAIKSAFGFMFIGLAIWMLSRILPGTVNMTLWAALIFISGVFMGGLTTLTSDSTVAQKLGKGFGLLAILYGLILFLGALTGGTNPLKPMATLSFSGGGAAAAKEQHLQFTRVKTVDDLDREIANATAAGKTVMLDFYADWCVSCIEMEEYTFITAEVQDALANTVALQADVTNNDEQDQGLLKRFGVFGPPTIIFFGPDGAQRQGYEVVGFMNSEDFANHVRRAFAVSSDT